MVFNTELLYFMQKYLLRLYSAEGPDLLFVAQSQPQ